MKVILKLRKKGVVILPKKLRRAAGLEEGDELIAEVIDDTIVLKPIKPKIVDVDPRLVERLLSEEYKLEKFRYKVMFGDEEDSS